MLRNRVISLIGCTILAGSAMGQENSPTAEGIQFFEAKIRPILVEHCYRCHSAEGQGQRGGLSVDSRDALAAGGESGPAIVPGNLEESLLWNAVNYRDFKMPPKNRLPQEAIADIRRWIEMGAPDPRTGTHGIVHSKVTPEDIEKGKEFWSFKAPSLQKPGVSDEGWSKTEIDRYISAKHREHQLEVASDADGPTLLRRLTFDLIGLPPSMEDVEEFHSDYRRDPDRAVATVVDRLLDSPQFGERWGRHWLDVARYAESTGKEVDMTFAHAWRYRNYVIDSFNQDKPYDQFVREQVAGDLLPAKNDEEWAEHLIATGFLAIGPKALIEQSPRQFQADLVDEQIDTTTRVFLGVSVACARCHDHKFDPIPQTDYYALAGIFQSTETFYGGTRSQRNRQPSNLLVLPINDPNPGVEPISKTTLMELKKDLKEKEGEYAEARRAQRQSNGSDSKDPRKSFLNAALLDQVIGQLSNRIHSVDEQGNPLTFCMGVQDSGRIRNARLLVRGEIDQPAQEVGRGLVQVLCNESPSFNDRKSGRLELARWMSDRSNPLVARVMVNRIWQHLIGQAIVRETENFGASGPGPTHPELLDYLAIEFMDQGWSIKQMIRNIANSRVYRLSSRFDEKRFEADPDNLYVARANKRRLEAEAIRDAMLLVSGQIDLKRPKASLIASWGTTMVGPNGPLVPPGGLLQTLTSGEKRERPSPMALRGGIRNGMRGGGNLLEAPNDHRSVYLPVIRNAVPRAMDVFDFAEPSIVVGQREESNTADQALFMLNNKFVIEQSEAIARRLIGMGSTSSDRIKKAFLLIYGREATADEWNASQTYFRKAAPQTGARSMEERGFLLLSQFCQALLSSAEFRYVN